MLTAESLCWRLFSLCWWFSQCIKSGTNISNLSPTHLVSNIRHQHRCNRFLKWNLHANQRVVLEWLLQITLSHVDFITKVSIPKLIQPRQFSKLSKVQKKLYASGNVAFPLITSGWTLYHLDTKSTMSWLKRQFRKKTFWFGIWRRDGSRSVNSSMFQYPMFRFHVKM